MGLLCYGKFYDSETCADCSSYQSCESEHKRMNTKAMDSGEVFDELQRILCQYTSALPIKTSKGELITSVSAKDNIIILGVR